MAVSKQPTIITPETSSGEGLDEEPSSRGEAKWKRFHPFRVVRKIFRRRGKRDSAADASKKSWSTSELQRVQEDNSGKCDVTSPLKIGLSVSHDSIFSPEGNANINSEELSVPRGSSLSVCHPSVKNMFKDELFSRVRARRDSDEDEDVGLPHSPCTSPTTVDVLTQGLKEKTFKLQTTCSAGSLISMESSENDEDSAGMSSSGHSSRLSLLDKRPMEPEGDPDDHLHVPLNHNAAHHKIAIRPKRTYGLPRRRMNQLEASKKSTLPATPEVFEETVKVCHSLEITESVDIVSKITESTSTERMSVSSQAADCRSFMKSQLLSSENADVSKNEALIREDNQVLVSNVSQTTEVQSIVSEVRSVQQSSIHDIKLDMSHSNTIEDPISGNVISSSKFPDFESTSSKELNDIKQVLMSKSSDAQMESVRLMKTSLQELIKKEIVADPLNLEEAPLKVSSLIKSIERSDSFKGNESVSKPQSKQTTQLLSDRKIFNDFKTVGDKTMTSSQSYLGNSSKTEKHSEFSASDEKSNMTSSTECLKSSKEFISEALKKSASITARLDSDSEFIFKPIVKKDNQLESNFENGFKISDNSKERAMSRSLFPEEESIMSDKSLSATIEESHVFVSHQVSYSDKLTDLLVTETHDIAAVGDKPSVPVQSPLDKAKEKKRKEKQSEPWISSVGISAAKSTVTDVTVNSLTSNFCDRKLNEDRVTISVHSKSESGRVKPSDAKLDEKAPITTKPNKSAVPPPKPSINPKLVHKDKSVAKCPQGSHLPDIVSSNSKSVSSQKRVSVEIVPFNQRMKERKYQTSPHSNKDASPELVKRNSSFERRNSGKDSSLDVHKKNPNVAVERKLSDSKVTAKNRESDKSNNRHSFSGGVTTNALKKDNEPATEKVSYPVQIRVHKSTPKSEIKEKIIDSKSMKELKKVTSSATNEIKFQMQSSKSNPQYVKEQVKEVQESPAKWEVKIQPSAQVPIPKLANSNISEIDDHKSNSLKKTSDSKPPNDATNAVDPKELESPPTRSRENSWKASKETPPSSDDPEPELMRVFARRSIKQKPSDKNKPGDKEEITPDLPSDDSAPVDPTETSVESSNQTISVSQISTVIKISEPTPKPHISKPDLIKKKSKSFSEKEKVHPRSASPLKEMNLIRRDSPTKLVTADLVYGDTVHPRQRLASVPDLPVHPPPDPEKRNSLRGSLNGSAENTPTPSLKDEYIHRSSSISVSSPTAALNGSLGLVKDSQDALNGKEPHTPAWLQLAQQRRELREQRERLLLGSSTNAFLDASSKPSRSSKVWDMVNNFQKLQMT